MNEARIPKNKQKRSLIFYKHLDLVWRFIACPSISSKATTRKCRRFTFSPLIQKSDPGDCEPRKFSRINSWESGH